MKRIVYLDDDDEVKKLAQLWHEELFLIPSKKLPWKRKNNGSSTEERIDDLVSGHITKIKVLRLLCLG